MTWVIRIDVEYYSNIRIILFVVKRTIYLFYALGHIRLIIVCFYNMEYARQLLYGDKFQIYSNLQTEIPNILVSQSVDRKELDHFCRLLNANLLSLSEDEIQSGGYVLHTLEASIRRLMTTDSYEKAVLKVVNLGYDADTTGAVTRGLAGLL